MSNVSPISMDITPLFLPYILLRISILDIFQSILIFIFRAVSELAEALRDSDDIKKERNETQKENKDLRERLEIVEKSLRMKMRSSVSSTKSKI